jgi:hypothetical protein
MDSTTRYLLRILKARWQERFTNGADTLRYLTSSENLGRKEKKKRKQEKKKGGKNTGLGFGFGKERLRLNRRRSLH